MTPARTREPLRRRTKIGQTLNCKGSGPCMAEPKTYCPFSPASSAMSMYCHFAQAGKSRPKQICHDVSVFASTFGRAPLDSRVRGNDDVGDCNNVVGRGVATRRTDQDRTRRSRASSLRRRPWSSAEEQFIGLSVKHAPHWHTYWKNPGDSGYPTKITWRHPPAWP